MTPPKLVSEMLDHLCPDLFRNSELKWIDNSCGDGNFLVEVKKRLLQHHSEAHILTNMIYGIDIQQDNANETKKRLNGGNIVCADALTFDYWGLKFDVVVGNPPYNKEKKNKKGNNCNPLWPLFVEHIIRNVLKDDGYLCLVHPSLWRKPEHKLWALMKNYQLDFIRIMSTKESSSIFGCSTKVDYYVINKVEATKPTTIIDEKNITNNIKIDEKPFIPNHSYNDVYKVFSGDTTVIYNCKYHHYTHDYMSKTKTDVYKYPCVYLVNKDGIRYYYSSTNKEGHFGVPKIIIPMGGFYPLLDSNGEYGMCEVAFGIPIASKEQGRKIMKFFNSDRFKNILSACKWKTMQLDYRLFKYLKIPQN